MNFSIDLHLWGHNIVLLFPTLKLSEDSLFYAHFLMSSDDWGATLHWRNFISTTESPLRTTTTVSPEVVTIRAQTVDDLLRLLSPFCGNIFSQIAQLIRI